MDHGVLQAAREAALADLSLLLGRSVVCVGVELDGSGVLAHEQCMNWGSAWDAEFAVAGLTPSTVTSSWCHHLKDGVAGGT